MCNTITGLGLHLALNTAEPVAAAFLEFRSSVFWRAYDMVCDLRLRALYSDWCSVVFLPLTVHGLSRAEC